MYFQGFIGERMQQERKKIGDRIDPVKNLALPRCCLGTILVGR